MYILDLVYNLFGLVALSVLSGFIDSKFDRGTTSGKIIQGIVFGFIAVTGMMYPYENMQGIVFDGKSIIISLSTLFFGPVSGLITAIFAFSYHLYLGGSILSTGPLAIAVSMAIGWGVYNIKQKGNFRITIGSLYIFSFLVQLATFLMLLAFPSEMTKDNYKIFLLYMMVLYPLIAVLIGKVLQDQEKNKQAFLQIKQDESLFRATLYSIGDAVITTDNHGIIMKMNRVAEELTGWTEKEAHGKPLEIVYDLTDEETGSQVMNPVNQVLRNGKVVGLSNESILTSRNLYSIPVADCAAPITNDKEEIVGVVLVFREQTEERAKLKSIQENARMFTTAFDNSPVPMVLSSIDDGKYCDVNSAFLSETGYSREEVIGKTTTELKLFKDPGERDRLMAEVSEKGKIYGMPFIASSKGGTYRQCLLSANIILISGKKYFLASILDITEQKHSEKVQQIEYAIANAMVNGNTLKEMFQVVKNELSSLIDTTNFIIALYDDHTGILHAPFEVDENNDILPSWPAKKSLTGLVIERRKPVLLNKDQIFQLAKDGTIELIGSRAECWLGVPLFFGEKTIGAVVLQSYSNPDQFNQNSVKLLEVIANQLSIYIDRKNSEKELIKLSKAVMQSPVIIVITDIKGNIEYINPKFTETTGYSYPETIGQNLRILKSGKHDTEFYKNLWGTILSGHEWQGEIQNRKKNGEEYWEKTIISPIINTDGTFTHFMAMMEDITESKKLKDELIIAKERAEESDRLKTAFLQNMSHEIRTPLNGLLGFAYLLNKDDVDSVTIKKSASIIESSSKRLLELMNNIIDLSKIESGNFEVTLSEFPLHKLLNEVSNQFKAIADSSGIELISPYEYLNHELIIASDSLKLHQILTNLLDNALKFTQKGQIEIGYVTGENELIFSVRDTGTGIPILQQSRIFDSFYQADMSITRGFEGSGLGLSICRGLVDLLKGKIWFESQEAIGTTFYFSIPCEIGMDSPKESKPETQEIINKYKKILIAEDDDFSFTFLETVLENEQVEIIRARTGLQAVKLCTERADIDMVLMDIKMPEMNGIEATRQIKALRPGLPVVAQTAYAFIGERMAAMEAGCDDYLTKPVSLEKLAEILSR
jgi:PAS domain S-box-containing protein